VGFGKLYVGGMGVGGRGFYALVGNKCKKTDDQTDTIMIYNNERKVLAF